jgi:phospholipase/carboxylesterase
MKPKVPECIEIQSAEAAEAAVIWLHGLGADGGHFVPLLSQLFGPENGAMRFVLPDAPLRPVTLSGGERLRAWYDISHADRQLMQDESSIRTSAEAIWALIDREVARGVPTRQILLGGFSQGGAMALFTGTRYPGTLAGIIALSCYRLLAQTFAVERQAANQKTPIFLAHGSGDPVIPISEAGATRQWLASHGYPVEWHAYDTGHDIVLEEIAAIRAFCKRALKRPPG